MLLDGKMHNSKQHANTNALSPVLSIACNLQCFAKFSMNATAGCSTFCWLLYYTLATVN